MTEEESVKSGSGTANTEDNETSVERLCQGCGVPERAWQGGDGHGYRLGAEAYCCRHCADGAGCACALGISSHKR